MNTCYPFTYRTMKNDFVDARTNVSIENCDWHMYQYHVQNTKFRVRVTCTCTWLLSFYIHILTKPQKPCYYKVSAGVDCGWICSTNNASLQFQFVAQNTTLGVNLHLKIL